MYLIKSLWGAILATFIISEFLLSALNMESINTFTNSIPYLKACVFLWIPCSDYIAISPCTKELAMEKLSQENEKETRIANCK